MSKHTPGPWAVHTPKSPKQAAVIARELSDGRRTVVAVIPDHLEFGNASVTDWNEQEANARLAAAAPELLAALRAIVEVDHPDADYTRMVERAKRIARNAIEKATGGKA
jgi:hypothetical protein